jgi:hypothetical protein
MHGADRQPERLSIHEAGTEMSEELRGWLALSLVALLILQNTYWMKRAAKALEKKQPPLSDDAVLDADVVRGNFDDMWDKQ